jgi:hypothetical protein
VGPGADMDTVEKRKSLLLPGIESRFFSDPDSIYASAVMSQTIIRQTLMKILPCQKCFCLSLYATTLGYDSCER